MGSDRKLRLQVGPSASDIKTATFAVSTPEQKTFERDPFVGTQTKRKTIFIYGNMVKLKHN